MRSKGFTRCAISRRVEMGDNAALVSLDLAELLLIQGNPREAGVIYEGLVDTFTANGSSTNAVRALS